MTKMAKMFRNTFTMKNICILLVLHMKTTTLIINGTWEPCGTAKCGYKAECSKERRCECRPPGAFDRITELGVQYCLEICSRAEKNICPTGTACQDIQENNNKYRCLCEIAAGFKRSELGQCVITLTSSGHPQTTDTSAQAETTTTGNGITDPDKKVLTLSSGIDMTDTDKNSSLPLYIGLGVGIPSCMFIIIILVLLIVAIRRRKRSRRSPASVSGEGDRMINNNHNATTPNARGEGTNPHSESQVDSSDKSIVNSKGNPQNNPTMSIEPSRSTHHHSDAYEEIDNNSIQPPRATHAYEDIDNNLLTKKFDNSETNVNEKSGLEAQHDRKDICSNHKIPDNKGKVKLFNLATSAISESRVGEKGNQMPIVIHTQEMENKTQYRDTNLYQTPYDLTLFSSNQRDETVVNDKAQPFGMPGVIHTQGMENKTQSKDTNHYHILDAEYCHTHITPSSSNQREETVVNDKALKVENNMNENPYNLVQPIGGAIGQNVKMEEQTTAEIENNYDKLNLQVLSYKDK